ncbi:TetR/AcrR family transcriptional regulator [Actinotalea sp. AC32]|nr:TetR/AcrR family transcriptional regulator [Actinotalea sp. AC32]
MSRITSATTPGTATPVAAPRDVHAPVDGRSSRWDDHRAARRTELANVARKAVHRLGPDVSMEEIASEARTSKSIVYRYFADKSGLQAAVGEVVLEHMQARLDEAVTSATTPREGLRSMIGVYLEMVEGSPNVYWFVTRPAAEDASASLNRFLDSIAALIARPFVQLAEDRAGSAALGQHLADVWAAGAVGFVRGAGDWWLAHRDAPDAPSREELVERVTAWLWAGPVGALSRAGAPDRAPDRVPDLTTSGLTTSGPDSHRTTHRPQVSAHLDDEEQS